MVSCPPPKYIILYLKLLLYQGPIWFKIMEVTNTLTVTVKKKGRERKEPDFLWKPDQKYHKTIHIDILYFIPPPDL